MKHLLFAAIAVLCTTTLFAQQDETLFNRNKRIGFYIAPSIAYGEFLEDGEVSASASLGMILGSAYFGFYGSASSTRDEIVDGDYLRLAHGGLEVGWMFQQHKLVHPYFGARIGWGGTRIDLNDNYNSFDDFDEVLVVSPQVGIELNVARFFRIGAFGNYRIVNGVSSTQAFTDKDLSGFQGGIAFKFGWFGRNKNYDIR